MEVVTKILKKLVKDGGMHTCEMVTNPWIVKSHVRWGAGAAAAVWIDI
jgi:hypothetical protein